MLLADIVEVRAWCDPRVTTSSGATSSAVVRGTSLPDESSGTTATRRRSGCWWAPTGSVRSAVTSPRGRTSRPRSICPDCDCRAQAPRIRSMSSGARRATSGRGTSTSRTRGAAPRTASSTRTTPSTSGWIPTAVGAGSTRTSSKKRSTAASSARQKARRIRAEGERVLEAWPFPTGWEDWQPTLRGRRRSSQRTGTLA